MATLDRKRAANRGLSDGELFTALDIGCSKISCLIARADVRQPGGFVLVGAGRQQSRGFGGGAITDMNALERSVRLAVEDAERQAGHRVSTVRLGLAARRLSCQLVSGGQSISGREVTLRDVRRIQSAVMAKASLKGQELLAAWPVAYRVDDQEGVRAPAGMLAERLGVMVNVLSAPTGLVRNLSECVARAHLKVDQIVPSSVASGAGCLIEDERENGAICVDMGAGGTSVCVFIHGAPAWLDLVAAGGDHVTSDMAQGLGTTRAAAERLKSVRGQADRQAPGLAERVDVPTLGDDGRLNAVRLPRQKIAEIVAPRVEEIFELVSQRLASSPVARVLPRRVVLTGGGSQLAGVREVAHRIIGVPVRLGRPLRAENLGEQLALPAFSTAAGLLESILAGSSGVVGAGLAQAAQGGAVSGGMVNRSFHWLRENF